jgi:alpha-tubulin suppressor-like RCC1 family protein
MRLRAGGIAMVLGVASVGLTAVAGVLDLGVPRAGATTITTFNFNGTNGLNGAYQTWTVPSGVTAVQVDAFGAQGANGDPGGLPVSGGPGAGAKGGEELATLIVSPGDVLEIVVGGHGHGRSGGYNGGADGGTGSGLGYDGGGGGGASDVRVGDCARTSSCDYTARAIVAGGGGGGGGASSYDGGNGGQGGGLDNTNPPCFPWGNGGPASGGNGAVDESHRANGGCAGVYGQLGTDPWGGQSGDNASGGIGAGGGGGGGGYGGGGGGYGGLGAGEGGGGGGGGGNGLQAVVLPPLRSVAGVRVGDGMVQLTYTQVFPTTTRLVSSANPSAYGQGVTFTATVAPLPFSGTIQFTLDGAPVGAPVAVDTFGRAMYSTSSLVVGDHVIGAGFRGGDNYADSDAAPLSQSVRPAWSLPVVAVTSLGGLTGTAATFAVTVTGSNVAGSPTGVVHIDAGDPSRSNCNATLAPGPGNTSTGNCLLAWSLASPGAVTIPVTASYTGDSNYVRASATITVTAALASAGTATASQSPVTAQASGGSGVVTVVSYGSNPAGNLLAGHNFVDVAVSPGSTFSQVVISLCANGLTPAYPLWWWNPALPSWDLVRGDPGPNFVAGSPPCWVTTIDQKSSPKVSQLTGTVFAVSPPQVTVSVTGHRPPGSTTPKFNGSVSAPKGVGVSGSVTCTTVNGGTPISPALAAGLYTIDGASCSGLTASDPTAVFDYQGGAYVVNGIASIAAGAFHACARYGNGSVACWGRNVAGALGNAATTNSSVPVPVSGLADATAVSAGVDFTCALRSTKSVVCWGDNTYAELGNGSNTNSSIPVAVRGLSGVTAIAAGGDHACALLAIGTVRCWGRNELGELGNGTTVSSGVPVPVSGLADVSAIASGGSFSCAVAAGAASCWGYNVYGALGNGTTADSSVPVGVYGLSSGVSAITAGAFHACALVAGGLRCWGFNSVGQLGDGTFSGLETCNGFACATVPEAVKGVGGVGVLSGVSAISAGTYSDDTCALLSGGTERCWGYNAYGQLGNGTTIHSPLPVPVTGLTNVAAISAGGFSSCALIQSKSTVMCWGDNRYGQLGNGTTTNSRTPVTVTGL